jgi:benzoyl-CoA reductase/2-hydroxyglutaryl-CoA dehydratase subunit BcrC/BadD/HgdB
MLAISALCDGNLRSMQEMNETLSSDLFFIDCPIPGRPGSVSYLADQLQEVFERICRKINIKNARDRLEKTVRTAEYTRRWMMKANEARRGRYFPKEPLGLAGNIGIQTMLIGSPGLLRFYRTLYQDLERRAVCAPPGKRRILLMHLLPLYRHAAIDRLFSGRCFVAAEEYTYLPWPQLDPRRPFRSIAERLLSQPQLSDPERRISLINGMIDDYSIDGVVHISHWGCRQSSGAIQALSRFIKRPFLNLEIDLVDPDSSASGQISTRIEGFLEMLESRV